MFKICLIGCGYMTRDGHGPSCAQYAQTHSDTVLAACCDINLEVAQAACEQFGFRRAYTDYREMVEKEQPDVVMAITPVALTAQVSMELLNRNIPVFLEKPPGMNPEQAHAIHEANGFYDESRLFFDELRRGERPVSDVITGASSVAIAYCMRKRVSLYTK